MVVRRARLGFALLGGQFIVLLPPLSHARRLVDGQGEVGKRAPAQVAISLLLRARAPGRRGWTRLIFLGCLLEAALGGQLLFLDPPPPQALRLMDADGARAEIAPAYAARSGNWRCWAARVSRLLQLTKSISVKSNFCESASGLFGGMHCCLGWNGTQAQKGWNVYIRSRSTGF
jgi:hypothetical protein